MNGAQTRQFAPRDVYFKSPKGWYEINWWGHDTVNCCFKLRSFPKFPCNAPPNKIKFSIYDVASVTPRRENLTSSSFLLTHCSVYALVRTTNSTIWTVCFSTSKTRSKLMQMKWYTRNLCIARLHRGKDIGH